jgi:hypothetical protein
MKYFNVRAVLVFSFLPFSSVAPAQEVFPFSGPIAVWWNGGQTCADLPQGRVEDGVAVQLWQCPGPKINQTWDSVPTGDGKTFLIKNRESGKCLEVINGSYDDGANIVQRTCNSGDPIQWWYQKPAGTSSFYRGAQVINRVTNKCIEAPSLAPGPGANGQLLRQWSCAKSGDRRNLQIWANWRR